MRKLVLVALLTTAAIPCAGIPSAAAQSNLEPRVDRLEREMRAVQRTVFPGGTGKIVTPDIDVPDRAITAPGTPATNAVVDLDARVAGLERQQATLTGQIEQNQFRLRQLEDAFAAYKSATDARLGAPVQGGSVPAAIPTAADPRPGATPSGGVTRPVGVASSPGTSPTRADPDRATRLGAVERPASGDAGEDAYLYGYRLWDAKLYPEAEVALKETLTRYPQHKRASYAQNLLGRAYLDEGRPSLASMAFYDSFKKYPDGDRAPDSLYYLGQSLMKLNKPTDACKVYAELDASYGAKLTPELKARADKGRVDARCK